MHSRFRVFNRNRLRPKQHLRERLPVQQVARGLDFATHARLAADGETHGTLSAPLDPGETRRRDYLDRARHEIGGERLRRSIHYLPGHRRLCFGC